MVACSGKQKTKQRVNLWRNLYQEMESVNFFPLERAETKPVFLCCFCTVSGDETRKKSVITGIKAKKMG